MHYNGIVMKYNGNVADYIAIVEDDFGSVAVYNGDDEAYIGEFVFVCGVEAGTMILFVVD